MRFMYGRPAERSGLVQSVCASGSGAIGDEEVVCAVVEPPGGRRVPGFDADVGEDFSMREHAFDVYVDVAYALA